MANITCTYIMKLLNAHFIFINKLRSYDSVIKQSSFKQV